MLIVTVSWDNPEDFETASTLLVESELIEVATKNLSDEFKACHPEVEWRNIAGMRDKLVHHYFGVDWEVVWIVLVVKIPPLRENLKKMIEERRDLGSSWA